MLGNLHDNSIKNENIQFARQKATLFNMLEQSNLVGQSP